MKVKMHHSPDLCLSLLQLLLFCASHLVLCQLGSSHVDDGLVGKADDQAKAPGKYESSRRR